jgi:glycosyltransferase involved in cell wall biosynthesis
MKNPRVSVVVTTYNRAKALERCIASVLAQSLVDFELIVVDDASQDGSAEVAASFHDERLHYERLAQNAGAPARPRNVGAALATAPLLFIFDSDDTMLPGCLASFVDAFAAQPRLGLAWSWKNLLDREGHIVRVEKRDRVLREPRLPFALVYGPGANGLAIRREVFQHLGGFDEALPRMDDHELWLRFALDPSWDHGVLPIVTMNVHCDVGGHISANPGRTLRAREYVLSKHAALFARYPKEHARYLYQIAQLRLAVSGDRGGFLRALVRSLLLHPVPRRALGAWRALPFAPTTSRATGRPATANAHLKHDDG